jgi:hypothetical protein
MAVGVQVEMKTFVERVGTDIVVRTIVSDIESHIKDVKGIFREVANVQLEAISKQWVEDNQGEILKHLNPQAVANLAIADSARHVREKFIDPPKKESKK